MDQFTSRQFCSISKAKDSYCYTQNKNNRSRVKKCWLNTKHHYFLGATVILGNQFTMSHTRSWGRNLAWILKKLILLLFRPTAVLCCSKILVTHIMWSSTCTKIIWSRLLDNLQIHSQQLYCTRPFTSQDEKNFCTTKQADWVQGLWIDCVIFREADMIDWGGVTTEEKSFTVTAISSAEIKLFLPH